MSSLKLNWLGGLRSSAPAMFYVEGGDEVCKVLLWRLQARRGAKKSEFTEVEVALMAFLKRSQNHVLLQQFFGLG